MRTTPPLIRVATYRPTVPSTVSSPPVMPAPTASTRDRSPAMRRTAERSPRTSKRSPTRIWFGPSQSGRCAMSRSPSDARALGTRHSASTMRSTGERSVSVMVSLTPGPVCLGQRCEIAVQDAMQMKMVRTELATVVAGGDAADAGAAGGGDAGAHGGRDGGEVHAVEHDLEHRVHAVGEGGIRDGAECGRKGIVGGRDHVPVALRSHLAAAAHDAAGEWK